MIKCILNYYIGKLQLFLAKEYPNIKEEIAELGFIGSTTESKPNKIIFSLLSLEKDAIHGSPSHVKTNNNSYQSKMPSLYMNMNIIIAAIFDEKRYKESLSVLSSTLLFLQSNTYFKY